MSDPRNSCPNSILSVASKVYESLFLSMILFHTPSSLITYMEKSQVIQLLVSLQLCLNQKMAD